MRRCRVCGCTDCAPCIDELGQACAWVGPDLCSACAIARCDREIAAMYAQPPIQPAWLTTLGIEDWEAEKRLILKETRKPPLEGGTSR
jgi:hypothetical protein